MKIALTCGLANRIRTLMGYLWLAERNKQELNAYWEIGNACNGHFLDIFQPIIGVNFVDFDSETKMDFEGQTTFNRIFDGYLKNNNFTANIDEEQKRMYRKLQPLPRIQEKVNIFCEKNKISTCIGMHIRRTDHEDLAKNAQAYSPDDDFIEFIQNNPSRNRVFIATDNKKTQDRFVSLYGDRVIFHTDLTYSTELRKTSLEEALIDILVCIKCRRFKGSGYSSYSDLIHILRSLTIPSQ